MDSIMEQFILDVRENGVKMDSEKLTSILEEVKQIILKGKDHTKEELVESVLQQFTVDVASILGNQDLMDIMPGYNVALKVGNISTQIMDGYTSYEKNHKIAEQTMFDIASCSKLFTQIIAYNLIHEGVFSFDSKVSELDPRFDHLQDLTIGDITRFATAFKTPKRIDDCETTEKAYDILYNTEVVETGKYDYNDIGMIILKEVMENVTKKSYEELVNAYIITKLNLNNTFVKTPKERWIDLTATPNSKLGLINDPKAVLLGGYSGHAGVVANATDLLTVGQAVFDQQDFVPMVEDVYTPNDKDNRRGVMGNTYVYHEQGIEKSFVSNNEAKMSFRVQGSTRNVFGASKFILKKGIYTNCNAILLNPASMSIEKAKEIEAKINQNALEKWIQRNPNENSKKNFTENVLVKNFQANGQNVQSIDPRRMLGIGKTSDPITEKIAETSLKLMFLDVIMKEYESENEKDQEVNVVCNKSLC